MITMEVLCSTIWLIIALKNISKNQIQCVKTFISNTWDFLLNVDNISSAIYLEKSTLKISSGTSFESDWISFETKLFENLAALNIESHLKTEIKKSPSKMIQFKLLSKLDYLMNITYQSLHDRLKIFLENYANNEIQKITENLNSENFFNLSKYSVHPKLQSKLSLGRKFTPFLKINIENELKRFDSEIYDIVSNIAWGFEKTSSAKNILNLFNNLLNSRRVRDNKPKHDTLSSTFLSFKRTRRMFLKHLHGLNSKTNVMDEFTFKTSFSLRPDQIIVAADKNIGFVCMDVDNLLEQYSKINKQQHFGKVDISETDYLLNITSFLQQASNNIPHELSLLIKPSDFVWNNQTSSIGVLRLMPKILKLKTVNRTNISSLTSRGIKSAMNDPIKTVQKTLDKLFSHLLHFIELKFTNRFNILSPSVNGMDEAINRIKNSKVGAWGRSIEIEGDFGDLYSNCNETLLLSCIKTACKFALLSTHSYDYIESLVKYVMRNSYFLEPSGTFRTLNGFSMGDCSAARGSEIILRIYEFEIWKKLFSHGLHKNVHRYLRFRDDVSVHISGPNKSIKDALKIIITGYPAEIQFNVESKILWGKFLNIRIFNNPTSSTPYTTVLRKENFKYDIIPYNSNVPYHYKLMAGRSYFRTARSHTTSKVELRNQLRIVSTILKLKKFPDTMIHQMKYTTLKPKSLSVNKRFLGTTIYDKVSLRHSFVSQFVKNSSIDKNIYFLPMPVPGPKLEQYVFTVKKMRRILTF